MTIRKYLCWLGATKILIDITQSASGVQVAVYQQHLTQFQ